MRNKPPLSAMQLEERMDFYRYAARSSRRAVTDPAHALAGFSRSDQDFVVHWGQEIARDYAELAYQFKRLAVLALDAMVPVLERLALERDGEPPGAALEGAEILTETRARFGLATAQVANAASGAQRRVKHCRSADGRYLRFDQWLDQSSGK